MTLSDDLKTQLETIVGHPTVYLGATDNGEAETHCWIVNHGKTREEEDDVNGTLIHYVTPFTIWVKAADETTRGTDVASIKSSIRAKAVTGGHWEVQGDDSPELADPGVIAEAVLEGAEERWA